MYSERDGRNYYPKYSEDLVHTEVMLPANAPPEYSDPAVLIKSSLLPLVVLAVVIIAIAPPLLFVNNNSPAEVLV